MAKKKKKKLKMKKKTFILLIAGICAVALIAEIVLMTMVFSRKKPGSEKQKERKHKTETGLIVNPEGNACRLLKYVEYGPTSAKLHEYSYDKYGRRTVETNYQAVWVEAGRDPSESDMKLYVESEIVYEYDDDDRMIKAIVSKNKDKTVYTYEYDENEGYLKGIYCETGDSEERRLIKAFNERGLLVKETADGEAYKRYELDGKGHVIAVVREGVTGDSPMFAHELEYEYDNAKYETLKKRTVKNQTAVEGVYGGYSSTSDRWELYNEDGSTKSIGTEYGGIEMFNYQYNELGLLVMETRYNAEYEYRDKLGTSTYAYNDKGLPLEEYEEINEWGSLLRQKTTTTYQYGEEDRILRKTLTVEYPQQKKTVETVWEYEYDADRNPLKIVEIKGDAERVTERFEYVRADVPKKNLTQEDLRRMGKEYDMKTRMDPKDSVFDMPVYYSEKRWGEAYYFAGR